MKKVIYKVAKPDGTIFETPNYNEATTKGNRIVVMNYVHIDETTEKEKEQAREHARKVREKIKERKAKGE